MLELVYPGEERSCLFAMLFLHRLTPAVRLQFTEDDYEDVRALADNTLPSAADSCFRHHRRRLRGQRGAA